MAKAITTAKALTSSAGLSVFPIRPGRKAPNGYASWRKEANNARAPEALDSWAPDSNYGVNCGFSGLLVVDIDCKEGRANGFDTLEAYMEEHDVDLPETYSVRTPSGGLHLYYRVPDDGNVYGTRRTVFAGVDLQGNGSMVVGPGSRTVEDKDARQVAGEYVVEDDLPIAPLPEWLGKIVITPPRKAAHDPEDVAPSLDKLRAAVEVLPNADDTPYDTWKETGGMIMNAAAGRAEWIDIFHAWSVKSAKHDDHEFDIAVSEQLPGSPYAFGWDLLRTRAGMDMAAPSERLAERLRAAAEEASEPVRLSDDGLPDTLRAIGDIEMKPTAWRVQGLMEQEAVVALFAQPGVGKSFIALDVGLSVATGTDFAGQATEPCSVIYIAGEGEGGIVKRANAWAHDKGVDLRAPVRGFRSVPFFQRSALSLLKEGNADRLCAEIEAVENATGEPVGLIVIDTLARVFAGGNENSNEDMGNFIEIADHIKRTYGTTVLLVHHSGKGDQAAMRGASALRGAVDTEIMVSQDEGIIRMSCTKQKEDEAFGDLMFKLQSVTLDEEQDIRSAFLKPIAFADAQVDIFSSAPLTDCADAVERFTIAAGEDLTREIPRDEFADGDGAPEQLALLRRHKILVRGRGSRYKAGAAFLLYARVHGLVDGRAALHSEAERATRALSQRARDKLALMERARETDP